MIIHEQVKLTSSIWLASDALVVRVLLVYHRHRFPSQSKDFDPLENGSGSQ